MNDHAGDEVQLDIVEQLQSRRREDGFDSDGGSSGSASFFEPWIEPDTRGRGSDHGAARKGGGYKAAEKRVTRFALQLAVLEKAASVLGKLAFVWATVVLLGGFASSLRVLDFWSVTVVLVGEGARVFSRGNELEWQRYSTRTSTAGGGGGAIVSSSSRFCRRVAQAVAARACGRRRTVVDSTVQADDDDVAYARQRARHAPPVPYAGWVFVSKNAGAVLQFLQVLSSAACVALSVIGLCKHDRGGDDATANETRNQRSALVLFYCLALAEATLFLLEKALLTWKISFRKLLDEVLEMTMRETESEKLLEASIGLTTQICKFLDGEQFARELRGARVDRAEYTERLASILRRHTYPEIRVPRVRRFVVLQAIWLMQAQAHGDDYYVERFRKLDMGSLLESIADTTSDLECFHVFSGSVGLSQHRKSFTDIVESALELLDSDRE
ncbi:hypothetical protein EJB05_10810, partial [Eragrostis curvula]